jgi:hypothetical protein
VSNAPSTLDRALASTRALNRADLAELPLTGIYVYTVVTATPLGISANPADSNLPPIQNIPAGNIGPTTLLSLIGQNVLVIFANQDPSKPKILSVAITATMLTDATMTSPSGLVTLSLPLVAPLIVP